MSVRHSFASSTAERPRFPAVLLELRLETAEEGEGIGGRPGESGEDLVLVEAADLLGRVLDDRLAQRHLAVSSHDDAAVAAYTDNRGGADAATGVRAQV